MRGQRWRMEKPDGEGRDQWSVIHERERVEEDGGAMVRRGREIFCPNNIFNQRVFLFFLLVCLS